MNILTSDIAKMVENNSLDNLDTATFRLSYSYFLEPVANSSALLFRLEIFGLWHENLPLEKGRDMWNLGNLKQQVLEVILMRKPIVSATDPGDAYGIVKAELASAYDDYMEVQRGGIPCASMSGMMSPDRGR